MVFGRHRKQTEGEYLRRQICAGHGMTPLVSQDKTFQLQNYLRFENNYNMHQPKYQLTNHPLTTIQTIIESILTDQYLNQHPSLADIISANPKGYIPIHHLLNLPILHQYIISSINEEHLTQQSFNISIISSIIRQNSNKLITNRASLRRVIPYINLIHQIKPLYIEGFSQQEIKTSRDLYNLLNDYTPIVKVNLKKQYAFVKALQPKKLLSINGSQIGWKKPITIHSFSSIKMQIQSMNNLRVFNKIKKIYTQQLFQNDNYDSMEESQIAQIKKQNRYQTSSLIPNYNNNFILTKLSHQFKSSMHFRR